jgi:Na+/melibiose symporter-like transporter
VVAGLIGSIAIITFCSLSLVYLPDNVGMGKRSFVPTIANFSSVMWNSEFKIFLSALVFIWFISVLPTMLLYLFMYPMGSDSSEATGQYSFSLIAFIVAGFFAFPCIPLVVKRFGILAMARYLCVVVAVLAAAIFLGSYSSFIIIVLCMAVLGFVVAMANVIFGILTAEIIDYDELLCGKKRPAAYRSITNPLATFISIAGTSLPFAMMSATGFKEGVSLQCGAVCVILFDEL